MRESYFTRGYLQTLAFFYAGFITLWIVAVIAVWRLGLLPDMARPWFRTAFWVGAAAIWIVWRRPTTPMTWLGLWPISPKQAGFAIAAFSLILGWNILRIHTLSLPLNQLASLTPTAMAWGLVGVFVEELVFRGVVQTQIAEGGSPTRAIVGGTILFVLVHVPGWIILSIPMNTILLLTVVLVGIICGALRHLSGSLYPAVAVHWGNNLGAML